MKFPSCAILALALSSIGRGDARVQHRRLVGGKKSNKFEANIKMEDFTPYKMFGLSLGGSGSWATLTEPDTYLYQKSMIFGDSEDDYSICNAQACVGDWPNFATPAKRLNRTSVYVKLAFDGVTNFDATCPLPTMQMSVEDAVCMGNPANATINYQQGGAGADAFQLTGCNGGYDTDEGSMTLICTGTEDEVKDLMKVKPSDSPGWENRPFRDEAILMLSDRAAFWSMDLDVTWFQIVDMTESARGNACNTAGCSNLRDIGAYLRGNDSNFARVYANHLQAEGVFQFVCPKAGQTISLKGFCDGTDVNADFITLGSYGIVKGFDCPNPPTPLPAPGPAPGPSPTHDTADQEKYVEILCEGPYEDASRK